MRILVIVKILTTPVQLLEPDLGPRLHLRMHSFVLARTRLFATGSSVVLAGFGGWERREKRHDGQRSTWGSSRAKPSQAFSPFPRLSVCMLALARRAGYESTLSGHVAHLDRAPASEAGGSGFESRRAHS